MFQSMPSGKIDFCKHGHSQISVRFMIVIMINLLHVLSLLLFLLLLFLLIPFPFVFTECGLPLRVGNCSQQVTRYHYDSNARECREFVYSGCHGNLNNFVQLEDCHLRCVCSRPRDNGIGPSSITRYYYNDNSKSCEPFTYQGVGGNGNRFLTKTLCEQKCEPIKAKCKARPEFGKNCDRRTAGTYYYYDINSGMCNSFSYRGCGGSKNRFVSQQKCQQDCTGKDMTPSTPAPKPNVCFFQPVAGPCGQQQIRYYYDYSIKRCLPFSYSGCGGNGNNFETESQCMGTCQKNEPVSTTSTTTTTTTTTTTASPETGLCRGGASRGTCQFNLRRYYYDRATRQCREFFWSGCGGNRNRFNSRELCILTCRFFS